MCVYTYIYIHAFIYIYIYPPIQTIRRCDRCKRHRAARGMNIPISMYVYISIFISIYRYIYLVLVEMAGDHTLRLSQPSDDAIDVSGIARLKVWIYP